MAFYVCNGNGDTEDSPSADQMAKFLEDLDPEDVEHGAAWLADDDGNSLEYSIDGSLCFDREGHEPRHLNPVSREKTLRLWHHLAAGSRDALELEEWKTGTRPPPTREEADRRDRDRAAWQLQQDREFFDSLGEESCDRECKREGCTRGPVRFSSLCRIHHFEMIQNRPCPFEQ